MEFKLEDWLPQDWRLGPPLPEFLQIYWPWYKPTTPAPPPPPPGTVNLYGTVRSNGQPLPGVRVRIPSPLSEYQDYTDDNGYYEIPDLSPGTYLVEFSLLGYTTETGTVTLAEGNNLLDFSMTAVAGPALAHLYGHITDHYTGKALGGVTITLGGDSRVTGADGFYEFFDIVPGDILVTMTLTKSGYTSQSLPLYIPSPGDIKWPIVMIPIAPPLANLSGVVKDGRTGFLLPGVEVGIFTEPEPLITYTNSNGRYSFTNLWPGKEWMIGFYKVGYQDEIRMKILVYGDNILNVTMYVG